MRFVLILLLIILLGVTGFLAYRHFHHPIEKPKMGEELNGGHIAMESEESVARGVNFMTQGDVGKAKFEFEDAIRIDSNNYRAYYNLGLIYRAMGEFERAEGYYHTALLIGPKFYAAWNNLANIMMMKKAPVDTVLFYINPCVSAYPDCTDYVDTKIDALIFAGRMSEADSLWRKAFAKDRSHLGLLQKKPLFDAMRSTHR